MLFPNAADTTCMLWIYQRNGEDLRITTTFDYRAKEYVITMIRPHETTCERFKDAAAFKCRLEALENEFQSQRWHRVGDPVILRDGWRVG